MLPLAATLLPSLSFRSCRFRLWPSAPSLYPVENREVRTLIPGTVPGYSRSTIAKLSRSLAIGQPPSGMLRRRGQIRFAPSPRRPDSLLPPHSRDLPSQLSVAELRHRPGGRFPAGLLQAKSWPKDSEVQVPLPVLVTELRVHNPPAGSGPSHFSRDLQALPGLLAGPRQQTANNAIRH